MLKKLFICGSLTALLSLMLAGCGIKGDLYLPGEPQEPAAERAAH